MPSPKLRSSECAEQITVVEWCDLMHIPVVHIPNEGKRSPATANLLKSMGLRKGFPDLLVTRARGGYHGFAVEMKYDKGKTTKDQEEWLEILSAEGYACVVCWNADDAIRLIDKYDSGVNLNAVGSAIISEVSYVVTNCTGTEVRAVNVYIDSMMVG